MDKKAIKEAKLEGNGKKKEHVGEDDAGDYAEMLKYDSAEWRRVRSN